MSEQTVKSQSKLRIKKRGNRNRQQGDDRKDMKIALKAENNKQNIPTCHRGEERTGGEIALKADNNKKGNQNRSTPLANVVEGGTQYEAEMRNMFRGEK